jgi:iron complex transport system permease protein
MTARRFTLVVLPALAALMALSLLTGPTVISPSEAAALISGGADQVSTAILVEIRLPRIVAALIAGFALGTAGAAMQGLLRNPLAEPGTMGVSASAALCATAAVYFGIAEAGRWIMPMSAIVGALLATALIAASAVRQRGIGTMILFGVALSALSGAMMALFVNLAPNPFSLSDLINWTAGSVANRDWTEIAIALPAILLGVALLSTLQRSLTAMLFGEDMASSMGVDVRRARLIAIIGTGLATGGAVAIAGMIGFVGLIAPHLARALLGHDAGRLLLPSGLIAAGLLVLADLLIRVTPWGPDLHLGTLTALIGAPIFALIALHAGNLRHG